MPVVVTGGDEPLGRALVEALAAALLPLGGEVRAVVGTRAGQRALVPLGVRAALVPLDDVDVLAAVLQGAHTLVHAAGAEPADTLPAVAAAARDAGVARLLVVTGREVEGAVAPGEGVVASVLAADAER